MKKYKDITCPICQGDSFKKKATCKDYFVTGELFDICECQTCKFILTAYPPAQDKINSYYKAESYISHSNTSKGLINKIYHLVRNYMLKKKVRLARKATGLDKGNHLDVGAGIGLYAHAMSKCGWSVEAIETSSDARKVAKELYGINLKDTSLWGELKNESKDLITLWHVLEHIPNLNEIWENFHRVLTKQGTLIIAVPNPSSYDAEIYKSEWAAYDVPRHLWHFTPNTLKNLAQKHGFELAKTHTMPFDGFYISMMCEKNAGKPLAFIRGFWTGLKGYIQSLSNKEKSSSIIYIFKKELSS